MIPPDTSALLEHAGFVRALAFGVLGRDDLTDDALQETYLAALRSPPVPEGRLRSWLGSIGRRRALDLNRRERARRRHEAAAPPACEATAPDLLVARAELGRLMASAVLSLEAPYRDALLLRYYEGLAPRDIARRLALPVETVRTHVKRGLVRLREALDRDGRGRERWLSGVGALIGDERSDDVLHASPTAVLSNPVAIGAGVALLTAVIFAGFALTRRDTHTDRMTADAAPALVANDLSRGANGAPGGGRPAPAPPPPPVNPTPNPPEVALRPAPHEPRKAVPPEPPFVVEVTANGPAPAIGAIVVVAIPGIPSRRVVTNDAGRATFDLPRDTNARIFVEAKGMASRTFEHLATAKWRVEPFAVALERGSAVDGRVVDARTGVPMAGARIMSAGGGDMGSRSDSGGETSYGETVTDTDGRYHLEGLPRDLVVTIAALARNYRRAETPVVVDRGDRTTATELRLEPGGLLRVSVRNADGAPVAGARVAAVFDGGVVEVASPHGADLPAPRPPWASPSAESLTGLDGACELIGLPFQKMIHLRAEAALAAASVVTEVAALTPDKPDAAVMMTLRREARLRVLPTGPDATPLLDVRVLVDGVEQEVASQGAGWIEVGGLEPGRHTIGVAMPGRRGSSADVELVGGQTLEKSLTLELGAIVEGVVKDETGAPFPTRIVVATGTTPGIHPSQEAVSDAAGRFRISGLDPDTTYSLSAGDSSATESAPVEVKAPARDVVLTLERRARVILRAKLPPGGPVPDDLMRTIVLPDGTTQVDGASWEDGVVELHFDGGHATVKLIAPGYVPWSKAIETAQGTTLDLGEIELDRGLSIEGDVVDAEGRPMASANVFRAVGDHPTSTGEYEVEDLCVPSPCNAAGHFQMSTLPRRPSTLTAWAEGYLPAGVLVDPTQSALARPRLVLHRGCLVRVHVVDNKGVPVERSVIAFVPLDAKGVAGEPDERTTNGAVHVHRLPAGRWRLRVDETSTDVEVEEGTEKEFTLHLP